MTLHIITTSAYQDAALQDCLAVADSKKDELVLISDGVCGLTSPLLTDAQVKIFYLAEDAHARGIICSWPEVQSIDYLRFVTLTETHQSIHTWL